MRNQAIGGSDDRRGRGDDDSVQRKSMLQWKTINYDMADALHRSTNRIIAFRRRDGDTPSH